MTEQERVTAGQRRYERAQEREGVRKRRERKWAKQKAAAKYAAGSEKSKMESGGSGDSGEEAAARKKEGPYMPGEKPAAAE